MSRCLQGIAGAPAFILTVDAATRNFTVRKVGAPPEAGKSYELWLISDKLPQPRSLGVIGGNDFTARPVLSGYDADTINGATYAVTVEQAGGSPDGAPHSTPVFHRQADRDRAPLPARGRSRFLRALRASASARTSKIDNVHKKKTPVGSGRFP